MLGSFFLTIFDSLILCYCTIMIARKYFGLWKNNT